jgi:iron complex outermembrane receptor protein/vitamin B12 transporter
MYIKIPLLLALFAVPLHSAAEPEAGVEQLVVTGTFVPAPLTELTSSVSVLEVETIEALQKRNIADLLKTVPGLLVEEQGGSGGLTAVSIRGGEANFTLVMIDGVALNDPTNTRGGGFDFSNLNIASIERIEIVRGPQSAIYGSDALAGVINIITRRGEAGHQQRLRAEWGEYDFARYSFSATGALGDIDYAISLAQRDDGEPVAGSIRDNDEASVHLDWSPWDKHSFSLDYRYLDGERQSYPEQSGGPEYAVIDDLDTSDYRDQTLSGAWRGRFSSLWSSTLTVSRFRHEEEYDSPGVAPFTEVPPNGADTDYERDQVQWVNQLVFTENYHLDLGADYRREEGESNGYLDFGVLLPTDFEMDRSTTGVFAGLHAQLTPELLLQGSLRHDDPEDSSSERSLNLGIKYLVLPGTTLTANWGEAYKLPSFFALGHALVGNPDLKPETARSWDVGLIWTNGDSLQIDATYFFNDYEDLVDFDPEQFRNVNREQVETNGVEARMDWAVTSNVQLLAHMTYTDIDVKDNESTLTGRPQWRAGATALWRIDRDWHSSFDYQWTGEQYASSLHTGETVVEELDDYHRLDWNLQWQASELLRLDLALDNVFDEEYETAIGFLAPGRGFRVGISVTL